MFSIQEPTYLADFLIEINQISQDLDDWFGRLVKEYVRFSRLDEE